MASHEDVEFSNVDAFHKCFYDDSICNNDVVLSRKLTPDKAKISFLGTGKYLGKFILWFLIFSFYNRVLFKIV